MTKLSGSCLCGDVSYEADTEVKMMINCHCDDCRKATGALYGTLLFVPEDDMNIKGEPQSFEHKADSGNTLTKLFCSNCGSQVLGRNSMRPGIIGIRAGSLDQKDVIAPTADIYCDSAVPAAAMHDETKKAAKMLGA